jgi:hypothetical protein
VKSWRFLPLLAVLCLLSIAAAAWTLRNGWTLYYGDAEAHLNIARSVVDSRTPGYYQLGTVWLPLPHVLMLPFVSNDAWWRSGVAGAIPSAACFVLAGVFLFAATLRVFGSWPAAFTALGIFALNPNLLYLQSTPMNEPIFFATLFALLYCTVWFSQSQSLAALLCAAVSSLAASLARYEGWFLIPFVAMFILIAAKRHRLFKAALFGVIAALGPLYWMAHNWWYFGNFFEFYNGPYSAQGIYKRALDAGMARYPGDHDWHKALIYFASAALLCVGWPAIAVGVAGVAGIVRRRVFWPILLLLLPPVFYVWTVHSSGLPIFIPTRWPNTWYNTRYGLAILPALAFSGGALLLVVPSRWRGLAACAIVLAVLTPWVMNPRPDNWICWKESQVNSVARRAWTHRAASILAPRYRAGGGIFTSFGDLSGIFREAGIPLREIWHAGNGPTWAAALVRPSLFLHEEWAVAISGDPVATAILRSSRSGPHYFIVNRIMQKDAPVIEIYERQ